MVAVSEGGCEFHAVVLNPQNGEVSEEYPETPYAPHKSVEKERATRTVADDFVESSYDENGVFNGITFKNDDRFNFAFDVVDAIAGVATNPNDKPLEDVVILSIDVKDYE